MNSSFAVEHSRDPDKRLEVAALITEYGEYVEHEHAVCSGCPVVRSGIAIVRSMLEWRVTHGDGLLDHWTRRDIRDYLLRYLPTTDVSPTVLADAPTCVKDLIYFLADRGTLAGDDVGPLADATDELSRYERPIVLLTPPSSPDRSESRKAKRKAARSARKRNRRTR